MPGAGSGHARSVAPTLVRDTPSWGRSLATQSSLPLDRLAVQRVTGGGTEPADEPVRPRIGHRLHPTQRVEDGRAMGTGQDQVQLERTDLRQVVLQLRETQQQMLDRLDVDVLAAAVPEQQRGCLDVTDHLRRLARV